MAERMCKPLLRYGGYWNTNFFYLFLTFSLLYVFLDRWEEMSPHTSSIKGTVPWDVFLAYLVDAAKESKASFVLVEVSASLCPSPSSPNALNFIRRHLLMRLFSLGAFIDKFLLKKQLQIRRYLRMRLISLRRFLKECDINCFLDR